MKKPTETSLVHACLDLLRLRGVHAWRNNTTGIYDPTRKCFRSFGGLKGVSDILGLIAPRGRFLAVECKLPGRKQTPEQLMFEAMVRDAGGVALCVRSVHELETLLRENDL